ncbi:MAG: ATP-dependent 6-phosphofructokinase [Bacillota bacterium]|jgi:phosphofructokinase-like protein
MAEIRRIGVLTGGGDSSGLNAAIRGVVMRAADYGYEVLGIQEGWKGLVQGIARPLSVEEVREIITVGGTMLGSSRTNPFKKEGDVDKCKANVEALGLDAIVAIGGDDTLGVASKLSELGVPCVGVPKTMDNDVNLTDYCIGFDTSVTVAVDAVERLRDTARSHRRVMVLEVMGRYAGWVALVTAMAGGADWVLIPEVEPDLDAMCNHLVKLRESGRPYGVVVVSEGIEVPGMGDDAEEEVDAFGHVRLGLRGVGHVIGKEIEKRTGIPTRVATIGHIQRGGSPTVHDRYHATRLGMAAVDLVNKGEFGKMPTFLGGEIKVVELTEVTSKIKTVPQSLYEEAMTLFK